MSHNFIFRRRTDNEFIILAISPKISPDSYVLLIGDYGMELSDTGHPQPGVDYDSGSHLSPFKKRCVRIIGVDLV